MATDTSARARTAWLAAGELQTLVVVSGAHLISHLHIMVLPVLLPLLKEHMNVGFFELGLALTTYNIVSGLTQAPMGFVVDRIGARPILVTGLLLGGLAFLLLSVTVSYGWLIVTAVLVGLANCVYHPADYSILTDNISEDRIGRAFSVTRSRASSAAPSPLPCCSELQRWAVSAPRWYLRAFSPGSPPP